MILVGVTQRVDIVPERGERRDALDQRWIAFLAACGLAPMPLPNDPEVATSLLKSVPFGGFLLTGGNDLSAYGGDAPERDATEALVYRFALKRSLPILGVCRGMQFLQHAHGVALEPVAGHVRESMDITADGRMVQVNSYHKFGARTTVPELEVWAQSADGVIKAVKHRDRAIQGIMWHPERMSPFRNEDVDRVGAFFRKA
jgi:gamma-glutamyl-gamma-aminobutyrate hydrolase PuuD